MSESVQDLARRIWRDELTAAERAVAIRIWRLQPDKVIADEVGISEDTVRFHLKHLFKKFGVECRAGVALGVEWGCGDTLRESVAYRAEVLERFSHQKL